MTAITVGDTVIGPTRSAMRNYSPGLTARVKSALQICLRSQTRGAHRAREVSVRADGTRRSRPGPTLAPALTMQQSTVGGIRVSAFDSLAQCAERILEDARSGRGGCAVAINAEKVISAYQDRALAGLIDRATLRYPDGAGVVVAMRLRGVRTARVAGADLWLGILRAARGERLPIALIGASPRVLAATRARLEAEFPLVDIRVARDGFEGARDPAELLAELRRTRPQVVFVAMGSPRQERLIEALREGHAQAFYLGLGGSFDVYCGEKRRAPLWMQNHGLEWLFRFLAEPSRARRETKRLRFLMMLAARRL